MRAPRTVNPLTLIAGACVFAAACGAGPAPRVAPPVFDPPGGRYSDNPWVAIVTATPGALVYFTTDGTEPGPDSAPYVGPIQVSSSQTVRAIAAAQGYQPSPISFASYVIEPPRAAAPTFDPPGGDYEGVSVRIASASAGTTVHYTTDGSAPSTSSPVYVEPIVIPDQSPDVTLRAIAVGGGLAPGPEASAVYTTSTFLLGVAFTTPGCIANGTEIGGATLRVLRASPRRCPLSTGDLICGVNEACVTDVACGRGVVGLLSEVSRTNYLNRPTAHPKSGEATQTMPTGPAVAVHSGTGRMTVVAGTAAVAGLACTYVQAGTVCSWTVTSAGTMLVTTTAGTEQAQVESGTYRTTRMDGDSRLGDQISIENPLADPRRWCVSVDETPEYGRAWGEAGAPAARFALGAWGGANSVVAFEGGASLRAATFDSAGVTRQFLTSAPLDPGTPHGITTAYANGVLTVSVDGEPMGTTTSEAGAVPSAMPASLYLGGAGIDGRQAGACIGAVKVWRGLCR